jgi:hypothetical protein
VPVKQWIRGRWSSVSGLGEDRGGVVVGFAVVDVERQAKLAGERDLRGEHASLVGSRAVVAVVVEAALADGRDLLAVRRGQRPQPLDEVGRRGGGAMRMDADRRAYGQRVVLEDGGGQQSPRFLEVARDRDEADDACAVRAPQRRRPILGERAVEQVATDVDQWGPVGRRGQVGAREIVRVGHRPRIMRDGDRERQPAGRARQPSEPS